MQEYKEQKISAKAWLLLIILGFVWGSSFFLIEKGLEVLNSLQVASLRLSITFLFFIPILFHYRKKIPWEKFKAISIVGILGSGIPAILFALAQTHLTSSITGVLGSTTPLFTLITGMLFFGSPYIRSKVVGVIVGLLGTTLIILLGDSRVIGVEPLYVLLPIIATLGYSFSANTIKAQLSDIHPLIISSVSFAILGPFVLIVLFSSGFVDVMQNHENAWEAFGYIAILSFAGTFLGSILFFALVQKTNAVFATTVAYIIPLIATIIGAFNGEIITIIHILGLVLILCGVYLSRK